MSHTLLVMRLVMSGLPRRLGLSNVSSLLLRLMMHRSVLLLLMSLVPVVVCSSLRLGVSAVKLARLLLILWWPLLLLVMRRSLSLDLRSPCLAPSLPPTSRFGFDRFMV